MKTFKIATWNVNSLRVRLSQVLQWLATAQPDVLALQELKMPTEDFPLEELTRAGYYAVVSGQKTYNGVAILSREVPGTDIITDIPGLDDHQRRVLAVTVGGIRVVNLYVPNGESVTSSKYQYKLNWLSQLKHFLAAELSQHPNMIILGDFNIAPEAVDVHDPSMWEGRVLFSELERAEYRGMLQLGFTDCFRLCDQAEKSFSWWDYRLNAFKRNMGLRIDHILASASLAKHCQHCVIDKAPRAWERPSDHTPVMAEFVLEA
ncbi:MAG: exodeoxyribonuclease III [Gammaproteobacteria bacterium]